MNINADDNLLIVKIKKSRELELREFRSHGGYWRPKNQEETVMKQFNESCEEMVEQEKSYQR